MNFTITIPDKSEILSGGIIVNVAREKESWLKAQLGIYANKSGLYVQHSDGEIVYVGITCKGGTWGNFAERLRREFQMSSSQNSHLYRLLNSQKSPIMVVFYDLETIENMVITNDAIISSERKAMILEQMLIGIYSPPGNKK